MTSVLKNGAVFLHIPKTGGSWITRVLIELDLIAAPLGHEHTDWDRAFWNDRFHHDGKVLRSILRRSVRSRRALVRIKPDCFRFCFVREPLKWYESRWRFEQSRNWKRMGDELDPYKWHPNMMLSGLGSPDFNTFMHNVNKKRPGYLTEFYGWYVKPGIGFVGKQESLQDDLIKAFALMKLEIDPARVRAVEPVNETPSSIPKPEWDPKIRRETLRLEYASYVRFGYPVEEEQLGSAPKNVLRPEMSKLA
jgi:hypothetical protein